MTKNFETYLKLNKTGLQNKYVVIVDGTVIAKGEDIEDMLGKARQVYSDKIPFVARVPDERMLVL
ncbi:MAG: DUF5678 domain-containing protein [bacterium]